MRKRMEDFQIGKKNLASASTPSRDPYPDHAGKYPFPEYPATDVARGPQHVAIDLFYYLSDIVYRRKSLFVIVGLAIAAIFCLYACGLERQYESIAEIDLLSTISTAKFEGGPGAASKKTYHVECMTRTLTSSRTITRFIDGLNPGDLSQITFNNHGIKNLAAEFWRCFMAIKSHFVLLIFPDSETAKQPEATEAWEQSNRKGKSKTLDKKNLAEWFRKALTVRPVKELGRDSGIVQVILRCHRPDFAQKALQAYLEFFGSTIRDQLLTDFETERLALKKLVDKAEQTRAVSETALVEFANANQAILIGDSSATPFVSLVNRSVERMGEAREEKERIRSIMYDLDSGIQPLEIGIPFQGGMLAGLKQQLVTLELECASLKTLYSSKSPKIVQLQQKIDLLRDTVSNLSKTAVDEALESAIREEKVRERTLDETRTDATRINSLQSRYNLLRRKLESDNQICQRFLNALSDLEVKSETIPAGVTIIEPPNLPTDPVPLRRWLIMVVGIAVGLFGGLAVAWFTETASSTYRVFDIDEIAAEIGTRALAIVPNFKANDNEVEKKPVFKHRQLLLTDVSDHAFSHIIRDIETTLFLLDSENRLKTITVTSSSPQEGKTFLATSLAWAMSAREGQKTLVIDADMRRPSLHKVFGHEEPGMGLSTVLTEAKTKISDVIRRSPYHGLFYLTAGPVPADPLALLRSSRFTGLLRRLGQHFNNILIDSPPVLSFSDYMPICHVAKKVILVIKQGETRQEEVRRTSELLRRVPGSDIIGIVLNRAETSGTRYHSPGYYRSQHHYYYNDAYDQKRTST